jgi:hypothetical protein
MYGNFAVICLSLSPIIANCNFEAEVGETHHDRVEWGSAEIVRLFMFFGVLSFS